ncbi:MAG: 2Fe-2S iron-sulfur cluster binding domain-containing protein [Deltaproteobacteria bacterium]|nr:2Fe-2S iron-sulfur cluster binding domain-containing protein [Deltaproteobacteria bacterium]
MPKITFMPSGKSFDVDAGTTILAAAIHNGIHLPHDCTEAICGTDRVKVLSGHENLSEKSDNEDLTLSMLNSGPDDRLGCVAKVLGEVVVEIPVSS